MQGFNRLGARASIKKAAGAAAGVLALGLVSVGPLATSASAFQTPTASIANRTLTVTGTTGADFVSLQADGTTTFVGLGDDPANVRRFNSADYDSINVSLGNGNDEFFEAPGVLADKALTVDGGNGNDSIRTGEGNDSIFGGNGDDQVDAGRGNDNVDLGNGNDTFTWDPGDGSDTVDGGNGAADVMQFDGSNANETMSLAANGSKTVFTRDVANIRMDMDNIETFNLRALGGTDKVTIGNMLGTSVRQANVDLSGFDGNPDGAADAVTVNGTDRPERAQVTAENGQVDVAGFPAETRISGSETLDHLQVDAFGGKDQVTVDPNVAPLIGVSVDLGSGQI
jgi:Ca2+-binding RTX toxin-like protein